MKWVNSHSTFEQLAQAPWQMYITYSYDSYTDFHSGMISQYDEHVRSEYMFKQLVSVAGWQLRHQLTQQVQQV